MFSPEADLITPARIAAIPAFIVILMHSKRIAQLHSHWRLQVAEYIEFTEVVSSQNGRGQPNPSLTLSRMGTFRGGQHAGSCLRAGLPRPREAGNSACIVQDSEV
jgi:hypothetical protein